MGADATIVCELSFFLTYCFGFHEPDRTTDLGALTDWAAECRKRYDIEGTLRVESSEVVGTAWSDPAEFDARVDVRLVLTFIDSDDDPETHCYWMDSDWGTPFLDVFDLPSGWSAVAGGTSRPALPEDPR